MRVQGQIDLFFDGFGQAVTANQNHGVEVVGFGAVLATLGGVSCIWGIARIIGAPGRKHESKY